MPIRTHRGRAAVYRRLWGWPLRSPKHLAAAVIVLAVVAAGVAFLLPDPPPEAQTPVSSSATGEDSTPSASAAPTTAAPPSLTVPSSPPPDAPPDPAGVAVAEAWAKAWTNHPPGTSKQQWLDRLRPHTTPEFLPQMETVALANVPNAVTGAPRPVESTANTMTVRLSTDAGDIKIVVVNTPQGWRTASYDKVG